VYINGIVLKINDVCNSTSPNLVILYIHLPQVIIDEMKNFILHFNPNIEDTFIWSDNSNGVYTTKANFSWLLKQCGVNATPTSWSWICHLQLSYGKKYPFLDGLP